MDIHEWPRCIKSARRKRRLLKTDRDKQLIQLHKRREELRKQQALLPMVPLEHPYQRGWTRFFVLREDIKRGPQADFYQALLTKVNTRDYHHDKSFKRKKRRFGRNVYVVKQQLLREISEHGWQLNRMKLTENEKVCFTRVEFTNSHRRLDVKYVITEPWRYLLKVVPNMVTHVKLADVTIEAELAHINGDIDRNYLAPRMHRIINGRRFRWKDEFKELPKYINNFKNISRCNATEAHLDLET